MSLESSAETKIVNCGLCEHWKFDYYSSRRHGGKPWGYCKLPFNTKNYTPNKTLSAVVRHGDKMWLATHEEYSCDSGTQSDEFYNWAAIAEYTLPNLDKIIELIKSSS